MDRIMNYKNFNYDECLQTAKAFHGDACAGIKMGSRMAILGMNAIGIRDPKGADRKDFMVFVESDRCASDAILAVTGCQPGKRTLKIMNYGKMAATFVNLKTGKAVRVASINREGDQVTTKEMIEQNPRSDDYLTMPDEELFTVTEVLVKIPEGELPGRPSRIVTCASCGERVMDARDVTVDGKTWCRNCADSSPYYRVKK
jgi:formylmethanofuran dehydrogenase subunit E